MIIEISLALIAAAMVVLVILLTVACVKICKTLKVIQAEVKTLSVKAESFLRQGSDLAADIKKKSDSLNFIFNAISSISSFKRDHFDQSSNEPNAKESTIFNLVEWVGTGAILVKKIKECVKYYVKRK